MAERMVIIVSVVILTIVKIVMLITVVIVMMIAKKKVMTMEMKPEILAGCHSSLSSRLLVHELCADHLFHLVGCPAFRCFEGFRCRVWGLYGFGV